MNHHRMLVLSLILLLSCVTLFENLSFVSSKTAASPDPDSVVYLQLSFISISKIDGLEQVFVSDFYMNSYWYSAASQNMSVENDDFDNSLIFDPGLEFVNGEIPVNLGVENPNTLTATPQFAIDRKLPGAQNKVWAVAQQRVSGSFATPLDVKEFPYDTQFAKLDIESSSWYADQLAIKLVDESESAIQAFVGNPNEVGTDGVVRDTRIRVIGWELLRVDVHNSIKNYVALGNQKFSRMTVDVTLKRVPDYYLLKIVLGVMLLVYMCTWVFALQVDEADRMMGTLQVFSGLITFLFVASADVPKVPYQTRLDKFMNFSFCNVFCILIVHGSLYYFREGEDDDNDSSEGTRVAATGNDPHEKQVQKQQAEGGNFLSKWWNSLVPTRKWDVCFIPAFLIEYSVGVAIILTTKNG